MREAEDNELRRAQRRNTEDAILGERRRLARELHDGLAQVLLSEPPGLAIGKVLLKDKTVVLGVLGEPFLCQGKREITAYGGWRAYVEQRDRKT